MLKILLLVGAAHASQTTDAAAFPLPCTYLSSEMLEHAESCAARQGETYRIAPAVLDDLLYEDGLASIAINGKGWFYLHRNGRLMEVLTFDNGPDYFEEGLARARVDGKIVYVDRGLNIRIPTDYTFAFQFHNGRAVVCNNCVEVRVDNGEHTAMKGGQWGVIDREGREIVPLTLSQEEFSAQRQELLRR